MLQIPKTHRQDSSSSLPPLLRNSLGFTFFMIVCAWLPINDAAGDEVSVWVGTSGAGGIYHLILDTERGKMSLPKQVADVAGAGFLALHPNGRFLYSTAQENGEGGVAAFRIVNDPHLEEQNTSAIEERSKLARALGSQHAKVKAVDDRIKKLAIQSPQSRVDSSLKKLNFLPTGDGGAACVAVDKTGQFLMSAQYGGGSTSTYTIASDGSLGQRVTVIEHGKGSGVNPDRQAASHPHWVGTSPDNRFLMVPDLGMDRVVVYGLDSATGMLTSHSKIPVPPGAGPRHMKFHPSGRFAYVLNEMALTISVFEYEPDTAQFKNVQLIETLPESLKGKYLNSAAEIRVHPTGKFIYASNRGHDSISVFEVNPESGQLAFVQRESIRGSWPRNFNLDPTGNWMIVAGARSNTLTLFEVNAATGKLEFAQNTVNMLSPICVVFEGDR